MNIKSLDDLTGLRDQLLKVQSEDLKKVQIKVAMATCGIASGAKPVKSYFEEELSKRGISALVIQTGCMGYCYAEPTVEVTLPGKAPVVFGYVDQKKADEIIERYIRNQEEVAGIIPLDYQTIDQQGGK